MQNRRDQCLLRTRLRSRRLLPSTLLRSSIVALAAYRALCLFRRRSEDGALRVENYQAVKVSNSKREWQLLAEAQQG